MKTIMRMMRICANTANDDANKNKLKVQNSPPEADPPSEEKFKITSQKLKNYNPNCPNISEFTNNPNENKIQTLVIARSEATKQSRK
jgi:hypothetical protein